MKVHIYNEHLNYISKLDLELRLVHHAYFLESQSKLITAGIDGCFITPIKLQSKYEPKQAMFLDPDGKYMKLSVGIKLRLESMPLWVKGMKVKESEGIIISWS